MRASILLFLALSLSGLQSHAICEGLYRSELIEIKNEKLKNNNFNYRRSLDNYNWHLAFERSGTFLNFLKELPQGAKWIDMGAGEGRALIEGLTANAQISEGIAIAYQKPLSALPAGPKLYGRFRYLHGDFVENMEKKGQLEQLKGQVDLISDLYGPLSYSEKIPSLLQVYLDLLKPGGKLVFNIMQTYQGLRKNSVLTQGSLERGTYRHTVILDWFRSIPGVEVVEVSQKILGEEEAYSILIRKISEQVQVPETLHTIFYEEGSPPVRVFQIPLETNNSLNDAFLYIRNHYKRD